MVKVLKVETSRVDVPALAGAAAAGDAQQVARILDKAVLFKGAAGSIIERMDGPIFEEMAELMIEAVQQAVHDAKARA